MRFFKLAFAIGGLCFFPALARAEAMRTNGKNIPISAKADAAQGNTLYLHVSGRDKDADYAQLFNEIDKRFLKPLYRYSDDLVFSYLVNTASGGDFTANVIVAPATAESAEALKMYLEDCGSQHFHEVLPIFQGVEKIVEIPLIHAGLHRPDEPDPFEKRFSLQRGFAFSSLVEWENFTRTYIVALGNRDNAALLRYFEIFVNNDDRFRSFRDLVLTQNNMVAIERKPFLLLENGRIANPGWDESPFVPITYFRNCYRPELENGMCYTEHK